ncbi:MULTISPECIES: iron ABC transporter permease [Sulfitobacter]|uniref:FecCD family ABC transporter permease n=1 Tax=Sulfitobacter TaxID=60136 RepID=UPI0023079F95|nr:MULTISPECIES: iron ABC transporter permease [Sulfitobacter]MDF3383114.1 iron ABC transporter permease [Sulfitobacter sp. Ks11]MDF3386533.1 iron ABC transporter permease [Sulfitobacter sp. M85]MDF3389952.1 iron ABC transporter permease [Sulfitobacter sp. Ks16]MDF3400589.1 iron ABC transporter permease [Sulfitobacter sp. KE39]MDF3404010.1 iron ABC transporter permease [Sulfitobacter sp. Ks35]
MVSTSETFTVPADRLHRARKLQLALVLALALVSVLSLQVGPTDVSLTAVLGHLVRNEGLSQLEAVVLFDIRLPRLAMGLMVGAALAVSGAAMQGLFRNPLADPGIVGVGAGAGLGAILAIVLGALLPGWVIDQTGNQLVPFAAFLGGWGSTLLLYRVATQHGQTSVATMLLAGIALGALAGALSGILVYMADDQQLRDLSFWGLGSLAGASWAKVLSAGPLILLSLGAALTLGRGLNGLALGEATAAHIGIDVQRLKSIAILAVAGATGAAVAVSGGIGFIGIVVPHLLRLASGPDHRTLLVNAALLGAILLICADVIARVVIAPAELPIGIVTAVLGAPAFLWILLKRRGLVTQ